MTHAVIISLAANSDREKNLCEARRRLAQVLFRCSFSQAILTEPVGTSRTLCPEPYLNQLCFAETPLTVNDLQAELKLIESAMGRNDQLRRQGVVPIDLDVLMHAGQRYHLRDWERPYVAELLSQSDSSAIERSECK